MRSDLAVPVLLALQTAVSPQITPRVIADFAGYSEGIVFDADGVCVCFHTPSSGGVRHSRK